MKSKLYIVILLISPVFCQKIFAQANTSLSNLVSPTAVNQNLTPGLTNSLSVGSTTKNWKSIYIGTEYYLKNFRIIHAPGATNFFTGPNAGNPATTGTNNTALGDNALAVTTTGSFNTGLGFTALNKITVGSRNTASGYQAMYNSVGGSYNTATGERALFSNSWGSNNTASGSAALYANTNGAGNSAFGYRALFSNTTGNSNIAIGTAALYSNTTANNMVAVGDSALLKNTAAFNVAVGSKALMNNITGRSNVALGYKALDLNVSGQGNTAIGYYADISTSNLNNATAIGAYAQVNTSNSLILGSVNGINGAPATVNVGIGTNAPTERLHVVGNQLLDGNLTFATGAESIQFANPGATPAPMMYMFASGTINTNRMVIAHSPSFPTWGLQYADNTDQFDFLGAGSSRMTINLSTGNIGIGVTSPVYKLEVCGTIRAKEVRVETGWCDYVFEKDYKLRSIEELEKYVNEHKHLPGIAPAAEVEKEGLKVAEMNKAMMEKIEELSLYVIQLNKENKKLQAEIEALKQQ